MIYDNLNNVNIYYNLSTEIKIALEHLQKVKPDAENSKYQLNENILVMISEYETKIDEGIYEAHRNVLDIQYPLIGKELIKYANLKGLKPVTEYEEEFDRTFYKNPGQLTDIVIGNGMWAIFFKEDAHNPALAVDGIQEKIKKLVIKVKY